jgi:membrane-bound serine protease (ClpP class)
LKLDRCVPHSLHRTPVKLPARNSDPNSMTIHARDTLPLIVAALACWIAATDNCARADTLRKKDGVTLEGRVVAENADSITFESSSGGITLRQKIARAQIKSLEREVRQGPGYCAIPLTGEIGAEVTADDLQASLAEARRGGAQYVILVIDSPGGSVAEKSKILSVLADNRDLKFVAYVRRAISAAAVIAIACQEITMAPDASIGATVVFKVGPDGTPKNIEAKFASVVRAQERAVAEMGHHSDLWIRGMSEMDLELYVINDDGHPRLCQGPAPADAANVTVVKKKGQILTMTAREALAAGLSEATLPDLVGLRDVLGLKAWYNAGDSAGQLMASRTRLHAQDSADRQDRINNLKPELADIDARLKATTERANAAEAEIQNLRTRFNAEVAQIDADYQRDMQAAKSRGGIAPFQTKQAARERLLETRKRYEAEIAQQQAAAETALAEARQLVVKRSQTITAALPGN